MVCCSLSFDRFSSNSNSRVHVDILRREMAYEPSTQFHAAASYVTNAPQLGKVSNNVKLEVRPVLSRE